MHKVPQSGRIKKLSILEKLEAKLTLILYANGFSTEFHIFDAFERVH